MSLEAVLVAKGLETGALAFKEAKKIMIEGWRRAGFTDYDLEKVFWRSLYGTVFVVAGKMLYHLWAGQQTITHPEAWPEAFLSWFTTYITDWGWLSPATWGSWFGHMITQQLYGDAYTVAVEEEKEQMRIAALEQAGIPKFMDDLFGKYYPYLLLVPTFFFGLQELKDMKRRRKALK